MPKSKRDKKVSLTKTGKKGLLLKQQIIDDIRSSVGKYESILLFTVDNMRNAKLKDLRAEFDDSRFFFGKNKLMAVGLGRNGEEEAEDRLHLLSRNIIGQCGLLFTDRPVDETIARFENRSEEDFARAGFVATEDVTLSEGPLNEFPHSIEPHLRRLGLPTSLQRGTVTLIKSFDVCKKGQTLTPEQARILKLLNKPLATFKLNVKSYWSKNKGFNVVNDDGKESQNNAESDVSMENDET